MGSTWNVLTLKSRYPRCRMSDGRFPPKYEALIFKRAERHDWQKMIAEVSAMYQAINGKRLTDYRLGEWLEIGHESAAILRDRGEPRATASELLKAKHAELSAQLRQSSGTGAVVTQ